MVLSIRPWAYLAFPTDQYITSSGSSFRRSDQVLQPGGCWHHPSHLPHSRCLVHCRHRSLHRCRHWSCRRLLPPVGLLLSSVAPCLVSTPFSSFRLPFPPFLFPILPEIALTIWRLHFRFCLG